MIIIISSSSITTNIMDFIIINIVIISINRFLFIISIISILWLVVLFDCCC